MQEEFLGEKPVQEEFLGQKYVQEEFLGDEALGEKYMGAKHLQEEFLEKILTLAVTWVLLVLLDIVGTAMSDGKVFVWRGTEG